MSYFQCFWGRWARIWHQKSNIWLFGGISWTKLPLSCKILNFTEIRQNPFSDEFGCQISDFNVHKDVGLQSGVKMAISQRFKCSLGLFHLVWKCVENIILRCSFIQNHHNLIVVLWRKRSRFQCVKVSLTHVRPIFYCNYNGVRKC